MKRVVVLLMMFGMLCGCDGSESAGPGDSGSVFAGQSQANGPSQAAAAVAEDADEEQAGKEKLIAELMEESLISLRHGEDRYFFCYREDGGLYGRMIFSIFNPSGDDENADVTIKMEIPPSDGLFYRALEQDGQGMELSYDFWNGVVTFTIEKNNYHLDFGEGTFTHEVRYRLEDLDPDYLIAASPDRKLELYATYIDGGGEAQWGDYVILDTQTQEIRYLAEYDRYDHVVFCGSDQVLIVRNGSQVIELLEARTGKQLPNAPKFENGQSETEKEHPSFFIVGLAYDDAQKKTLIAYREFGDGSMSYEPTSELAVAVFDETGQQVNTVNTGFFMQPFVHVYPNYVTFESVEDGAAVLSTQARDSLGSIGTLELGTINY